LAQLAGVVNSPCSAGLAGFGDKEKILLQSADYGMGVWPIFCL
jgi:hypothetical protein